MHRLICFPLMLLTSYTFAQTPPSIKEALDTIADFADRFCQTVPLETTSTSTELSGAAKADLAGLVKKIANLGIEGAAKYNNQSSQNVLQQNLAQTLKETRDCRMQIWKDLKQSFQIGVTLDPKSCRDRSHGIERYGQEFDVTRTSHWMGGGYSQEPWCNDVIGQLKGEYQDGRFSKASSSEKKKSTCEPLNCPEYQYTCTVHVMAEPIYIEKVSSACN